MFCFGSKEDLILPVQRQGLCETPSPLIKQDPCPNGQRKDPMPQRNDHFSRSRLPETGRPMPGGTEAAIPTEHAAVIYVNEQPAFRVVCTLKLLPQLALGRLLTEGWIASAEEVEQISVCAEGLKVNIYLNHPLTARRAAAQEVSSCCTDNVTLGSPVEVQPLRAVPHLDVQPEWVDALVAARTWAFRFISCSMQSTAALCCTRAASSAPARTSDATMR